MNFDYDLGSIDTLKIINTTANPPLGGQSGVLIIEGNGAITLPQGATITRPSPATSGMFRWNQTLTALEYYDGIIWQQLTSTAGTVSSFQTSLSGLTPNTSTTGAINLSGTLGVASGGTGATTLTTNGVVFGNGTSPVGVTAAGVQYNVLTVNNFGVPTFGTIDLSQVATVGTSVLPMSNGGTNANLTPANGAVVYSTGSALTLSSVGVLGQVLTSSGAGAPTWTTASSTVTTNEIVQGGGAGTFTANGATFVGSPTFSGVTLNGAVTNATDATTKAYVDALTAGLSWKQAVRVATLVNVPGFAAGVITISNANATYFPIASQPIVIDGVTLVSGNRVLVKNQSGGAENGIYVVTTAGVQGSVDAVLTRADDMNSAAEFDGSAVFVQEGTQESTAWTEISTVTTVNTSPVLFVQFSGQGTYLAGAGLTLTGNTFSANVDGTTMHINGGNNLAVLSSSTIGQVLLSQGAGNTAAWGALSLGNSNAVSGTLATTNGGTGTSTAPTAGQVLVGVTGGTSTWSGLVAGTGISITATSGSITIDNAGVTSFSTGTTGLTPVAPTTGAVVLGGTLAIANGGTGATTAIAAFNALSPLTTLGDLLTNDGTNDVRLPVGTAGQVLSVVTGVPTWVSNGGLQLYVETSSAPTPPSAPGTNAVAIGSNSTASAVEGFAVGNGSDARMYGMKAFANGEFVGAGDAQMGIYVLRNQTTTAATTELFLDGAAGTQRIVPPNNSLFTFDILVAGRRTDATGGGAGYRFVGVIRKDTTAGSTTFVGTPSKTVIGETDTPWDASVVADTTTGSLRVNVNGQAGKTIRWVATVRTTEVTN